MRSTPKDRMLWLLQRMSVRLWHPSGTVVAWDQNLVDAFLEDFPESEKGAKHYTLGPSSVPMLNRAAKLGESMGYLEAGSVGNADARSYNQRTWCRTWTLTSKGRKAAEGKVEEVVNPTITGLPDPEFDPLTGMWILLKG